MSDHEMARQLLEAHRLIQQLAKAATLILNRVARLEVQLGELQAREAIAKASSR
jgi:hypothetical protein